MRLLFFIPILIAGISGAETPLFDFEQPAFIDRGYRVKDHALIHDGQGFHLFYTRGALDADRDPSLGHATSPDLRHWRIEAPVLTLPLATWADRSIWAPQILPADQMPPAWRPAGESWAMLFTGVNEAGSQSIGLAWSDDLLQWTVEPAPIYSPGDWAEWSESAWADCRDPFTFTVGDSIFLLATTRLADGHAALALAAAPLDAGAAPLFADRGPLLISPDAGALESPQLKRVTGSDDWWLFLTRGGVYGTSVLRAAEFRGPWDLASAVKLDEGAAPELNGFDAAQLQETGFEVPATAMVFSRHENYFEWGRYNYAIQFDLLDFAPLPDTPLLLNRQGLPGWRTEAIPGLDGPDAWLHAPTFEDNPMARGAAEASGFGGHSWLNSFEDYQSVTGGIASHVGDSLGAAAVGTLHSPSFTVTGERLDWRIGGAGSPDSCWLVLRLDSDGRTRFKATPPGGAGLPLVAGAWDTRSLLGLKARLEIVDMAKGPGGFIALDHLIWSDADPAAALPPLIPPDSPGFTLLDLPPNPLVGASPELELTLLIEQPGRYRVALYDIRGRRLRGLGGGTLSAGTRSFRAASDGLPAGLYLLRISGPGGALSRKIVLLR